MERVRGDDHRISVEWVEQALHNFGHQKGSRTRTPLAEISWVFVTGNCDIHGILNPEFVQLPAA